MVVGPESVVDARVPAAVGADDVVGGGDDGGGGGEDEEGECKVRRVRGVHFASERAKLQFEWSGGGRALI